MKQADLNRAVARATGESVRLIQSLGFTHLRLPPIHTTRRPKAGRISARIMYQPPSRSHALRRCA